nr:hypothetical protein CFP56_47615 [Quercus suber]
MGQFATTNQVDSSQKAPPPPRHGYSKGLMTAQGPLASGPVQRLVSHKKYAIEMVHSIIKDMIMDECGKHGTGDLEESSLFDLMRATTRILNFKVNEKKVELEATTRRCEELVKSNTNLMTELTTLHEQMEQVKANDVAEYQTSQPFYDELGGLYGDGFEDGLKQVTALYPNLDLS